MRLNIILILICIILIIFLVVKISNIKEKFQENLLEHEKVYPMKVDEINNLGEKMKLFDNEKRLKCVDSNRPRNIYVGDISQPQNNPQASINTNDTLFIKDSIVLSNNYGASQAAPSKAITIDTLRTLKYLPYNFDNKICIKNSCINKHHLKMLKGRTPMQINTFLNVRPIRFFSRQNFVAVPGGGTVYSRTIGTDPVSSISFPNGNGGKSIKITDPNYKVRLFSNYNFQGQSIELGSGSHPFIPLPNGTFRSIIPISKKDKLIQNMCLSEFSRRKTIPNGNFVSYGAVPCDLSETNPDDKQFFYIKRDELLTEHNHNDDPEGIHMHDHPGNVRIHDVNL
jgi:hypothetical protein